jgi:general stress protein 26
MTPVPEPEQPLLHGTHLPPVRLPWRWALSRLTQARSYWVATANAAGRPHTRPVWGVWLEDAFYFSTGSQAVANLARSPQITVHLESASEVVIVEGAAGALADRALRHRVVADYNTKYEWDMDPDDPPGPLYEVRPQVVFGWVVDLSGLDGGSAFHATATRWPFD